MEKQNFYQLISQKALKRHPSCFIYFLTWFISIIVFWSNVGKPGDWLGAYTMVAFYIALPTVSFLGGLLFGWQRELGENRWLLSFVFGLMYFAGICATFIFGNIIGVINAYVPWSTTALCGFLPKSGLKPRYSYLGM